MAADSGASTTPNKRSRVTSSTFGHEQLFAPLETSAQSKKSAALEQPSQDFIVTNEVENPEQSSMVIEGKKEEELDPILDDDVEEPTKMAQDQR